jgi:hypothetical protein
MQASGATSTQTFEEVKLVLSVVGFVVAVISIILVYKQMRKTHEWNRRKASHDTLGELWTGSVAESRRTLYIVFGMESDTNQTFTDVEANLSDDVERRTLKYHTLQLMNYLEVVCVGMKNHVLDEDICYDNAVFLITRFWKWAEPLIDARRKPSGDDLLWIEVQNYAKSWLSREKREREQHLERIRVRGKRPT